MYIKHISKSLNEKRTVRFKNDNLKLPTKIIRNISGIPT